MSAFSKLFHFIWLKFRNWVSPPYATEVVFEELPDQLNEKTLYIVEEDGFVEHAALICPCGCGNTLQMNLIPDEHPCWKVIRHDNGTTSLHPSVWRKVGCRSHFWFRNGRIYWCD